ncbi:TPA: hypothetical protein ACGJ0S_003216 [Pseudomonas aeruginosa]|nr:hypothetical protein [Pseudomonas aeruginosa]
MYFPDMSFYSYFLLRPLGSVRNIGWLGRGQQYSRGRVSSGLLDKLKLIIMSEGAVDFHVNRVMSAHECVVAGCRDLFVGDVGLGFSEIWIPGVEKGAYFASPSLILHYIEEHDYCPPQMYSEAVMAVDLEVGYKAQEVYVGLVAGHFWIYRVLRLLGLFQPIDKILLKVFQALRAKLGFFVNEGLEGYGEVGQKKHKFFWFSQEV